MFTMQNLLLATGSLLPLISGATYMWAIVRGQARPQITTRVLMMIVTFLMFISLFVGHDHSGVWLALTSFVQSIIIWLLTLKHGMGSLLNRLDMACLLFCAVGILLWLVSGQSLMGLLASIAADFIGCVPSLVKTWQLPRTETITFYALDTIAGLCVLFAVPITFFNGLFPTYICLINAALVVVIVWRRRVVRL